MKRVMVFAGTADGRKLCEYLAAKGVLVRMHVATEYAGDMLVDTVNIELKTGRIDMAGMLQSIEGFRPDIIVDATHPYAVEVTRNIFDASKEVGIEYLRLVRESWNGFVSASTASEAALRLNQATGNILLTVGSKELEAFTAVSDWRERVYARVLPDYKIIHKCNELGFAGKKLICMQGPFTYEMNLATIRQYNIKMLVTKDSGREGGFYEKLSAAEQAGIPVLVIGRPLADQGYVFNAILSLLREKLDIAPEDIAVNAMPRFPLFIDLRDRHVLVVGAGKIAARRIRKLLEFGAKITVVSPEAGEEILKYAGEQNIELRPVRWQEFHHRASDFALVIAATNDRATNRSVGEYAKSRKVPVSVADKKEESTFWFPATVLHGNIVAGIVSAGGNHKKVKQTAGIIRRVLEENE